MSSIQCYHSDNVKLSLYYHYIIIQCYYSDYYYSENLCLPLNVFNFFRLLICNPYILHKTLSKKNTHRIVEITYESLHISSHYNRDPEKY